MGMMDVAVSVAHARKGNSVRRREHVWNLKTNEELQPGNLIGQMLSNQRGPTQNYSETKLHKVTR